MTRLPLSLPRDLSTRGAHPSRASLPLGLSGGPRHPPSNGSGLAVCKGSSPAPPRDPLAPGVYHRPHKHHSNTRRSRTKFLLVERQVDR